MDTTSSGASNHADSLFDNIPDELKQRWQWVVFKFGPRKANGKLDKIPFNPRTGALAKVNDSATWGTFDETARAYLLRGGFAGIGFVFTENDPHTGIDLDGCRDPCTGHLEPWAAEIVERLDSYTEASPSGKGIHILCKAKLPGGGGKREQVEMYDRGRFFTFTGEHIGGTPPTIEDRQPAIETLYNEHFQHKEPGQGYKQSTLSEAEIERIQSALCCVSAVDYEVWLRVGMALHHADSSDRGFTLWRDWSATCPEKFNDEDCKRKWRSFKREGVTLGTLFEYALRGGWGGNGAYSFADDGRGHKEKSGAKSEPGPKQLQWYTIPQLREETSATIPYLVDGLLAEASLSVIGGKIAVGKSTLARTLAYCVTHHDVPFLGRKTVQGAVLYVAPEESKHGVMADLVALGFTDNDPLHLCFASNENVLEQVLAKMQETHARLVIFETIFRVLRIKDVNDYAQSTQKLDPVLKLARKTSAHVLFTHHLGKRDTTDALDALPGSTAIGGTPDTRIILKKKGDVRTVEVIQRYGQPVPETVLHYDPETKFITPAGSKEAFDKQKVQTAILETLPVGEGGLTEKELTDQVEGRTRLKREVLRDLVAAGVVNRLGKGGKSDPYHYTKKNSCSLVPTYIREQQNMNQKTELSPQEDSRYSCSQGLADSAAAGNTKKTREHVSRNAESHTDAHEAEDAETV